MVRITEELLRKRAEHNEGILSSLEEVSIHQYEIEKIENLDKYCRHLQICLLQNNIIEKFENLNKMKELKYLNVALNNISKIENLEGCESLAKLDLTCCFIDVDTLEESLYNLKKVHSIRDIYLTGNPCTDWPGWKDLTIAIVDQLTRVDGEDIVPSTRIKAKQNFEALMEDLKRTIDITLKKREAEKDVPVHEGAHTKENRTKMYRELAKEREDKENAKNPPKEPKPEPQMFLANGEIRQCNDGKYDYVLNEWDDPEWSTLEVKIPKHLDTSLLEANLNPKWISLKVNGQSTKLLQLRLGEEIIVEKSHTQRSQITGALIIKMLKMQPNYILKRAIDREKELKQKEDDDRKELAMKKQLPTVDSILKNKETKAPTKEETKAMYDDLPDLE